MPSGDKLSVYYLMSINVKFEYNLFPRILSRSYNIFFHKSPVINCQAVMAILETEGCNKS